MSLHWKSFRNIQHYCIGTLRDSMKFGQKINVCGRMPPWFISWYNITITMRYAQRMENEIYWTIMKRFLLILESFELVKRMFSLCGLSVSAVCMSRPGMMAALSSLPDSHMGSGSALNLILCVHNKKKSSLCSLKINPV